MKNDGLKLGVESSAGFTLLIAILTTSILLLVSFVVANVALKQIIISGSNQESQYAFYAADSGVECATYWDFKNPGGQSAFATSTANTISCNNQNISTDSQSGIPPVNPPVSTNSRVGGGGNSDTTSIFQLTFIRGCAIVTVNKVWNNLTNSVDTNIKSYGYNTCNTSYTRRVERGILLTY